jgi:hypothetical protein
LNRFREEDAGKHWGYPYCWTEFKLPGIGEGPGTVWAWPSFLSQGVITDDQCRADYVPPVVSMQAHSAPLGIVFFQWKAPEDLPTECDASSSFPAEMNGYAFMAFHGSWNRDVPTGYKVVYVPMDSNGDALGDPVDLLAHKPPNAKWEDGFRPVDVDFDDCGRLLVSSDGSNGQGSKIVRLEYQGGEGSPPPAPTETYVPSTGSNIPSNAPSKIPSSMPSTDEPCPCLPTNSPVPTSGGSLSRRRSSYVATGIIALLLTS